MSKRHIFTVTYDIFAYNLIMTLYSKGYKNDIINDCVLHFKIFWDLFRVPKRTFIYNNLFNFTFKVTLQKYFVLKSVIAFHFKRN